MKNQANKRMRAIALSATLSFAAAGYASQAFAQSAAPSSNSAASGKAEEKFFLEEIIVTAQKRTQSAEDVAIAMSVLGSDMLEKANVSNVTDLVGLVPSVQANYGAGQVVFNVRGIGTNEFAGNLDSPIAVNVDEVYMSKSFMTGLLLFDMDRIEVLKGPQGTLFGRNATGGTVNFYTRKPSQDTEIGQTISYDNYQTIRSETYVNGAISENLSGRLSALVVDQGKGYYRNITKGRREAEEKKQAVRGQLQYDNGNTTALFTVGGGRQKGTLTPYEGVGILTPASVAAGAPAFCAAYLAGRVTGSNNGCVRGTDGRNPGDDNPFTSTNNSVHDVDNKSFMTSFRVDHDFGSVNLTVLSSYNYFWRRQNEDADGGPTDTIDLFYNQKIKQMTHELRLAGGAGGAWNYMVGAYFERDWFENGDYAETARGTAPSIYSPFDQDVTALAFFANSDYAVNDEVTLIQGFRYSREKIAFKGGTDLAIGATGFPPRPTTTIARLSYADDTRSDDAATFKVGVEWRPVIQSDFVDKMLVYGNVSTGFRSGGYSATFATTQASLTSLSPEKITAYELGLKSVLADRKLQVNAAAFRYQFEDGYINIDVPNVIVPVTVNAGKISSYGVEADVQWRPVAHLELSLGTSWLDSTLGGNLTQGGVRLSGNQTVQSPHWTVAARGTYTQPINEAVQGVFSVNSSYRSAQFFETNNSVNSKEAGYWLSDASFNVEGTDGSWSAGLFVKNITNEKYRTYVNDLPGFGFIINIYGNPRTYGLRGSIKF